MNGLACLQALPAGVFADPYELAGLEALAGPDRAGIRRGARARVFGPMDLEALEPHASPTVMALWGPVEPYFNPTEPSTGCHARADGVYLCPSERSAAAAPEGFVEDCNAGRCGAGCAGGGPARAGCAIAADGCPHAPDTGQSSDSCSPRGSGAACAAPCNRSAAVSREAPCSGAATVALRVQAPLHARYAAPRLPADGSGWASFAGEPATYVLPPPLVLARCQGMGLVDSAAEGHLSGPSRRAAWTGDDCDSQGAGGGSAALRGACGAPTGLGPSRWKVVRALGGAGAAEARWHVPTGNPAHEGFVSMVSAAAFLLASAAMVRASFAGSWQ